MKVTHYHTSEPVKGMCKQRAIWGRGKENVSAPLIYLQRPKWIKDDAAWRKIVSSVQLKLPKGFEIT